MKYDIKPEETTYKGTTFRSKLEATWACIFDSFGVSWQYEPFGMRQPDFKIKTSKGHIYAEVKPVALIDRETLIHKSKDYDANQCIVLTDPHKSPWNGQFASVGYYLIHIKDNDDENGEWIWNPAISPVRFIKDHKQFFDIYTPEASWNGLITGIHPNNTKHWIPYRNEQFFSVWRNARAML